MHPRRVILISSLRRFFRSSESTTPVKVMPFRSSPFCISINGYHNQSSRSLYVNLFVFWLRGITAFFACSLSFGSLRVRPGSIPSHNTWQKEIFFCLKPSQISSLAPICHCFNNKFSCLANHFAGTLWN